MKVHEKKQYTYQMMVARNAANGIQSNSIHQQTNIITSSIVFTYEHTKMEDKNTKKVQKIKKEKK
jgi:hypothetical protein